MSEDMNTIDIKVNIALKLKYSEIYLKINTIIK